MYYFLEFQWSIDNGGAISYVDVAMVEIRVHSDSVRLKEMGWFVVAVASLRRVFCTHAHRGISKYPESTTT